MTAKPESQNTAPEAAQDPHEVGFFERRWRLMKAGASGVWDYLTKPSTYVRAVAWGVGLAAAGAGIAALDGPSWLAMGPNMTFDAAGLPALGAYAAKMVSLGVLFHIGTDMVKEGIATTKETRAACAAKQQGECHERSGHAHQQQQSQGYAEPAASFSPFDSPPPAVPKDELHR